MGVNYLDSTLRYGMDTDLWIRLSAVATPVAISACLAASREYGETKTSTGSFQRVEELRQIAEKYSGLALTPGALCYYLDTLHKLAEERQDLFPLSFLVEVQILWQAARCLLAKYGARSDGFPGA
jgi:hypothetical protein